MRESSEAATVFADGHRSMGPSATIGLALVGFFIPAAVFTFGVWSSPGSQAFLRTPEALTWILSNCAAFAVMPIIWAESLATTGRMRRNLSSRDWTAVLAFSALVVAAFLLPNVVAPAIFQQEAIPLTHASARVLTLSVLASLGFILPVAGSLAASARTASDARRAEVDAARDSYFVARDVSMRSLSWLSLGLSLLVVIYASFRGVMIAVGATTASDYPVSLLLVVAAFNTALVALAYFSAMGPIMRLGSSIRDHLAPMPELAGDWQEEWEQRKKATELLELDVPASRRFTTALSVSAPLVSGLVASLIGSAP